MPRSGRALPPEQLETPEGLRAMAQNARRLASTIPGDVGADRLREFAKELEARAAALEPGTQTFSHEDVVAVQQVENDDG